MTGDDITHKIQKLELDTLKAVTELQKDVQSLTREVSKLASAVQKMTENYVTLIQHNEDYNELRGELRHVKRIGFMKQVLVGLFSSILTAVVVYNIMQIIK